MNIGLIGMAAALGLSALGSGLGTGAAALAAVGGWKKCYRRQTRPFIMVAFSGAPLTQTIYGFLLMNFISAALAGKHPAMLFGAGVFGGLAIGLFRLMQGKAQLQLQMHLQKQVKEQLTILS